MTGTPKRIARLALAVVFVVPTIVAGFTATSVAAPTKAEVEAAQAELQRVSHELELAIEEYNEARVRLQGVQDKLAGALDDKQAAEAVASKALAQLEDRAVEAYTGAGSQMDVLLGASDLSEFSDRLEFMGALAQNDADLATQAENAQQQAQWAADRYAETIEEKTAELDQMSAKRAEIQSMLDEQEALYQELNREYEDYLARQEAQAEAAEATSRLRPTVRRCRSPSRLRSRRSAPSTSGERPALTRSTVPGSRAGRMPRPGCTCRTRRPPRRPTPRCRTARSKRATYSSSTHRSAMWRCTSAAA